MKINYGGLWATIVGFLIVGLGVLFALAVIDEFYLGQPELPFTGIAMIIVLFGWGASLIIASRKKYIGSWRLPIGALLVGSALVFTGGEIDDLISSKSEDLISGIATIIVLFGWGTSLIIASRKKYIGSWRSSIGALLVGIAVFFTGGAINDLISGISKDPISEIGFIVPILAAGIVLIYTKMRLLLGLVVVVVVIISWWVGSLIYIVAVQGTGPELVADLVIPETVCVNETFSVFVHATNPHDETIDFSNVGIPAPFLENFEVLSVWPDAEQIFDVQNWFLFEMPVEPGRTIEVKMEFMAQIVGTYTTHFEVCTLNAWAENCERIVRTIAVQPASSC